MTQLHRAASRGDKEAVLQLLSAGLPVDSIGEHGNTPLMEAATSDASDVDMLRILVEHGADINLVNQEYGWTAFQSGCHNFEKTKYLLGLGADPFRGNLASKCLPHTSSREVMRLLLDLGFDPTCNPPIKSLPDYPECPGVLESASHSCDWETIKFLMDYGVDINQLKWTGLMRDVIFGSLQDVERALKNGADLHARDVWLRTPLLLAVCSGDITKAEKLLSLSAEEDQRGRHGESMIDCAIQSRSRAMMEWVIAQGFDVNMAGVWETPLLMACMKDNTDAVQILLQHGASIELEGTGWVCLNETSEPEIVRLLVAAGASLNHVDSTGMYPLKHAVETGKLALLRTMLELGADTHVSNFGFTALHQAVNYDDIDMMKLLLESGADPNAEEDDGHWRPLWWCKSYEAVHMLLKYGASLTARDEFGNNAFQFHHSAEFRELLRPPV